MEGQDSRDGRHWKAVSLVQAQALPASSPFLSLPCFPPGPLCLAVYFSASLCLFLFSPVYSSLCLYVLSLCFTCFLFLALSPHGSLSVSACLLLRLGISLSCPHLSLPVFPWSLPLLLCLLLCLPSVRSSNSPGKRSWIWGRRVTWQGWNVGQEA